MLPKRQSPVLYYQAESLAVAVIPTVARAMKLLSSAVGVLCFTAVPSVVVALQIAKGPDSNDVADVNGESNFIDGSRRLRANVVEKELQAQRQEMTTLKQTVVDLKNQVASDEQHQAKLEAEVAEMRSTKTKARPHKIAAKKNKKPAMPAKKRLPSKQAKAKVAPVQAPVKTVSNPATVAQHAVPVQAPVKTASDQAILSGADELNSLVAKLKEKDAKIREALGLNAKKNDTSPAPTAPSSHSQATDVDDDAEVAEAVEAGNKQFEDDSLKAVEAGIKSESKRIDDVTTEEVAKSASNATQPVSRVQAIERPLTKQVTRPQALWRQNQRQRIAKLKC